MSSLRKLSTLSHKGTSSMKKPLFKHSKLFASAQQCPIMSTAIALRTESAHRKSISTSPICPFAATVDTWTMISNPNMPLHSQQQKNATKKSGKVDPSQPFFSTCAFDYEHFYKTELDKKKQDKSYRYFNNINRLAKSFPEGHTQNEERITVWCANDYLGMSKHPKVVDAMK